MKTFTFNNLLLLLFTCFSFIIASAQTSKENIPHLNSINATKQLIVNGKPFIMLAGELHNSSSSSLEYMETAWKRIKSLNLNTVLASVTWEMIEPEEGKFDFSNVDGLITKARENHLKLVFLWFGTWKNACSSYTPAWVRKNTKRFLRSESADGSKLNNISCLSTETCKADANAFSALMKHIKGIDEKINTVLAIQVENEAGIRGDSRDRSIAANEAFNHNVPNELMDYLKKNKEQLIPEMSVIWNNSNFRTEGTWTEIFGNNADLVFMAWNTASYIDKVAAAGKTAYPIPMYANAWLDNKASKPGDYPSGGPIAKMFPIWKAAAPYIDLLAPDIYRPDFANVCTMFQQMNNSLFIPEVEASPYCSANVFYAIGQSAICFSPFGIDNPDWFPEADPIAKSYQVLSRLMPYLTQYQGTGKMVGLVGAKGEKQEIKLGKYKLLVNYIGNQNPELPGYGLAIALADDEFLVAGKGITVTFLSGKEMPKRTEVLAAYEMVYKNNTWVKQRRLNGDETGAGSDHNIQLQLTDDQPSVKTAKVFSYQ
jgi:hypothetical protein